MSDASDPIDPDSDRAAILARRKALIDRALTGLRESSRAGAVLALAVGGLTGCPQVCLSIAYNDEETGACESPGETETGGTGDTGDTGGTGDTGDTGGTETDGC